MRSLSATALLLDVVDLQERDRIVTFLSAEHGKKRGVAKGARTKFSRFAGRLLPLSKVRIGWFEKEGRELVRIQDIEIVRSPEALHGSLEGLLLGSYLAEHAKEFALEDDDSSALFRLLDTTLEALFGGADHDLAARYMEVWVLRLAGIFPTPWECPLCGLELQEQAFLLRAEAMLVCPTCAAGAGLPTGAEGLDFLRRSARENLPTMGQNMPPSGALRAVEKLCREVRRNFLQKELKSYRVMRDTLRSAQPG